MENVELKVQKVHENSTKEVEDWSTSFHDLESKVWGHVS